jgi:hypothetical protein
VNTSAAVRQGAFGQTADLAMEDLAGGRDVWKALSVFRDTAEAEVPACPARMPSSAEHASAPQVIFVRLYCR